MTDLTNLLIVVIGVLLAAVAFFIKRLIDRVDSIYKDYLKFFGEDDEEGEKALIWKKIDKHRHDIAWLEIIVRRNLKDLPDKKESRSD